MKIIKREIPGFKRLEVSLITNNKRNFVYDPDNMVGITSGC
jgi:hypothetical protein